MSTGSRRPRRIAVITGTRAEYGLLESTLDALERQRGVETRLVVTGIHLLPRFGLTVREIENAGRRIDARVAMQKGDDSPLDQAQGLARGVKGIAEFLEGSKVHVAVVLGDRIEAMAGALAAVTTGCVLAHIHGGDVAAGDFDDSFRHAITKLAHVHLAATREAARRIVRMGEDPGRVHVVGAPGLDRIRALLAEQARVKRSGKALVVHHACGRSPQVERRTMEAVLSAVARVNLQAMVIYPNTDRGHAGVIQAIEAQRTRFPERFAAVHRSLPRDDYLRALIAADVLVGNSSSGIIEAGFAGTPAVNVGPRQQGRQPGGGSVVNCGESAREIEQGIRTALRKHPAPGRSNVYGSEPAGPKIAAILARLPLEPSFRRKLLAY